jgi:hypothetical protein
LADITLDFTGGQNIQIENQEGLVAKATIKPMSSSVVAVIRAYDTTWSTPLKIKLSKRSPTKEDQEEFIKDDLRRLESEIRLAQSNWANFPIKVATQEKFLA